MKSRALLFVRLTAGRKGVVLEKPAALLLAC